MQLFKCSSRTFWDYYINSLWPFVDIVSLYSRSTLVIFSAHIILHTPWMYSRLLSHSRSHSHTDQHTYGYSHTRVSIFIASSLDTLYRWRHRYTNHTCISRIQRSLILNTQWIPEHYKQIISNRGTTQLLHVEFFSTRSTFNWRLPCWVLQTFGLIVILCVQQSCTKTLLPVFLQ